MISGDSLFLQMISCSWRATKDCRHHGKHFSLAFPATFLWLTLKWAVEGLVCQTNSGFSWLQMKRHDLSLNRPVCYTRFETLGHILFLVISTKPLWIFQWNREGAARNSADIPPQKRCSFILMGVCVCGCVCGKKEQDLFLPQKFQHSSLNCKESPKFLRTVWSQVQAQAGICAHFRGVHAQCSISDSCWSQKAPETWLWYRYLCRTDLTICIWRVTGMVLPDESSSSLKKEVMHPQRNQTHFCTSQQGTP